MRVANYPNPKYSNCVMRSTSCDSTLTIKLSASVAVLSKQFECLLRGINAEPYELYYLDLSFDARAPCADIDDIWINISTWAPTLVRVSLLPMKVSLVGSYSLQKEQGHMANNNYRPCLLVSIYKRLCCQQEKNDDDRFWDIIVQPLQGKAVRWGTIAGSKGVLSAFSFFTCFAFHVRACIRFSKQLTHRTLQLPLSHDIFRRGSIQGALSLAVFRKKHNKMSILHTRAGLAATRVPA